VLPEIRVRQGGKEYLVRLASKASQDMEALLAWLVPQDFKVKQDRRDRPERREKQDRRETRGYKARQGPKDRRVRRGIPDCRASQAFKVPQVHRVPLECRVRRVPKV